VGGEESRAKQEGQEAWVRFISQPAEGLTGRSEYELRAQQIKRVYRRRLAGAKAHIEVRKGRSERGQGALKKELWQGAASQRQKVCKLGRQRGWM
jgi:hypothetical protein